MSVQTQIDRISGAVSAAIAALSEKGVTVPAGTKVDGLAALIAAIEAGGGSGDNIHSGEIIIAEDCTQFPINHGFDSTPSLFFAMYDLVSANSGNAVHSVAVTFDGNRSTKWYFNALYSTANGKYGGMVNTRTKEPTTASGAGYYVFKSDNTTLTLNKGDTSGFTAGQKYLWIAMR